MSDNIVCNEEVRVIYINDPITPELARDVVLELLRLEALSADRDITMLINSPGGSVQDGLTIIDTMRVLSPDVETINMGTCSSMAALILMSGTKGKRRALPHSRVVLHQPYSGPSETMQASDVSIMAQELARTKNMLCHYVADCTGQPLEAVARDCDRDYHLDAEAAVKYGVVDEIVTRENR